MVNPNQDRGNNGPAVINIDREEANAARAELDAIFDQHLEAANQGRGEEEV